MKKDILKIVLSIIIFFIAYFVKFNFLWINRLLFVLSYLIIAFEIIVKASENAAKGELFDEEFLMVIATIGAIVIGEYPEAVAVMVFYEIGEILQDLAIDRSKESISGLMELRPDYANLIADEEIIKKNPSEIEIDEIILINPGEKVPLDGIIIEGKSSLDVSALTGESIPKSVEINEEIYSGSINLSGVLKLKVTKKFDESTVSRIIYLAQNASEKKAKTEKFIDKFSKIYTPIVVLLALLIAVLPPLLITEATWNVWIYRALTFLVVSCPCAMVISVPLSFFGGIGGASRKGILIKGGNYLEALAKTKVAVFDKTGTLTKGVFKVQEIKPVNISKEKLLEISAYSENYSNHPIAISIKNEYGKNIDSSKISETEEIAGKGIKCKVDNDIVYIGNSKILDELEISVEKPEDLDGTITYVVVNNVYEGYILISDEIKEKSKFTIDELEKFGVETVMLTGDTNRVAKIVSEKIGINEFKAGLLPEDKVKEVLKIIDNKKVDEKVIFVGDGVNDSPVLATADVGIAMGGIGSDAAIETADVVIMNDDISKINTAINLSKKTLRIVKQNVAFALIVKALVLILTTLGISNMWEAVFADVGVTLIAILSSLRTMR